MTAMKWTDAEDIAIALSERHPDTDPLTVRFTDLHRWVVELAGFSDDPKENPQSIDNCVLARPWKALLRDDNLKPQARRALYEAAAAYLHVRLIAYATTVEEFKRVDVRYRRQLVNREAALNQWRNLVAVPTDELNGYYSGGIKPAELADLVVKALGFTAIAIGVAQ